MADLSKIVEDLSQLTVIEAAELSKMLEQKWGVSAAAPVAVAAAGGAAAAAAPVEEKTEFDVVLAEQDQRHQGSPRHHRPRTEGGEGSGRGGAEGGQGSGEQGRRRQVQGAAGKRRRESGSEVTERGR